MTMQPVPDPYRVLGVARGATLPQIKAAHRALAKRYHPDAPGGDTARFLAVQEAYALLSDAPRRRDWDARHATGPVRATDAATRPRRGTSGRGGTGHWTREEPETGFRTRPGKRPSGTPRQQQRPPESGPPPEPGTGAFEEPAPSAAASDRDPGTRRHTWSAEGVPWWEDFPGPRSRGRASPEADRAAGPHAHGPGSAGDPSAGATPRGSTAQAGSATSTPRGSTPPGGPGSNPPGAAAGAPGAFDVYSRSSGAAWSSAARRYFRRSDADLPRYGVFERQGTQVVTGARAREVADARARAASASPRAASDAPPGTRAGAGWQPAPSGRASGRQAFEHDPVRASGAPAVARAGTARPVAPSEPPAGRPPAGQAAMGTSAGPPRPLSARTRPHGGDAASLAGRAGLAAVAWLPLAGLAGFVPPAMAGCGSAVERCPEPLVAGQALVAISALTLLLLLPVLARLLATATVAALAVAVPLVVGAAMLGMVPPTRPIAAAGAAAIVIAYLLGALLGAGQAIRRPPRTAGRR